MNPSQAMPKQDSGKCPETYKQVMDNCYYNDARQMEFYFAENHCLEKSGQLLNADTKDDILLALKVTRDINRSVWVNHETVSLGLIKYLVEKLELGRARRNKEKCPA